MARRLLERETMRIALVTEASSAGVGRHVDTLARGLQALNHEPFVFFSPRRSVPWFEASLKSAGVPAVAVDMQRSVGLYDVVSLQKLRSTLNAYGRFDVVHGHSSKAGGLVRLLPARTALRVYSPHAFVTRSPELSPISRVVYEGIEKALIHRTDLFCASSTDERLEAERLGFPAAKVTFVSNGIDTPSFLTREAARQQLGIPTDAFCLGFIGRFSAQKRPLRFLDVAALTTPTSPMRAVLLGGGELLDQVHGRAAQPDLASRVIVHQSHSAWMFMRAFDVLLMTSAYEGMPYVLLEALYAGLPIITDPVGGVSDLVEDQANGYLLGPQAAPRDIANLVERLSCDEGLRRRMAQRSLEMSHRFTRQMNPQGIAAAYRKRIEELGR